MIDVSFAFFHGQETSASTGWTAELGSKSDLDSAREHGMDGWDLDRTCDLQLGLGKIHTLARAIWICNISKATKVFA